MHILIPTLNRFTTQSISLPRGLDVSYGDIMYYTTTISIFHVTASRFLKHRNALIVLAVFVFVGFLVLDDYGVGRDADIQRNFAIRDLDYLQGRSNSTYLSYDLNRFYGVSFELPLLLVERTLGLQDTRDIHLMRHIITHLFFLTGGFFSYILAYRMFNNQFVALFAMLLFLLHPRIYAHSFFNSKDIPFLSMFMICLYLTYWAFMKGGIWRFLTLGVAAGILINLRIMGMTLFVVIVGAQLLEIIRPSDFHARMRVPILTGVFVLSSMATLYVVSPYLWSNPVDSFKEWFVAFSQHENVVVQLFRGDLVVSTDINHLEYVPAWISISTPTMGLALGVIGMLAVAFHAFFHPLPVFGNTQLRFGFVLMLCLFLPVVAMFILKSNIYNGWRLMYFLYAPLCLLAVFGLHWLTSALRTTRANVGLYGAAGVGMAVVAMSMVSIHPYEHVYFNLFVDRTTPEHLRSQYEMDYWYISFRDAFYHLLDREHDSALVNVQASNTLGANLNLQALAEADRERMALGDGASDFYIANYYSWGTYESERQDVTTPLVYSRVIYNSKVMGIATPNLSLVDDVVADSYRDAYSATISNNPVARSEWDIYLDGRNIIYIKESCTSTDSDADFFLHLVLSDIDDLPDYRRNRGYATRNFDFHYGRYGVRFDGRCVATVSLPDYDISGVETGQWRLSGELWRTAINIREGGKGAYREEYEAVIEQSPIVSSEFNVYMDDDRLIYVREPCIASDTDAEFFLHIVPSHVSDLPPPRRESGFDNLDFVFDTRGLMFDGMCIASIGLPDYDIERIRTGQWDPEQQRDIWKEEFEVIE